MKAGFTVDNYIEDITDTVINVYNDHVANLVTNSPEQSEGGELLGINEFELIGVWKNLKLKHEIK